jgi:1,4-dihydroxy-2-naphthoate octaprenyltransferase
MRHAKTLMQSMRIPFLLLTPACVFLGATIAISQGTSIDLLSLALVFLGALSAHISVNTFNEYHDFSSGLDLTTTRTPFSGGSGALPHDPGGSQTVLAMALASLAISMAIGTFFLWKFGLGLLPLGLAGLLLIVTYTGRINRYPLLCLIAPGFGFGVLMVVGTQFILSGEYARVAWLIALIPFLLVNNLLLLNQYPDIQPDAAVGRNHLPIAYGTRNSTRVYALFVIVTIIAVISYRLAGYLPPLSYIALLPMPLAFFALYGAVKHGESIGKSPQYLAANVAVTLLTPCLLGISIVYG